MGIRVTERLWLKQCQCPKATASTGRVVIRPKLDGVELRNGESVSYTATSYGDAPVCDVCDMPWKLEVRTIEK